MKSVTCDECSMTASQTEADDWFRVSWYSGATPLDACSPKCARAAVITLARKVDGLIDPDLDWPE